MIAIKTTMPTITPITPPILSSSSAVKDEEIVAMGAPVGLVAVLEDVWGRITVADSVVKGLVSVAVAEAVGVLVVSAGGKIVVGWIVSGAVGVVMGMEGEAGGGVGRKLVMVESETVLEGEKIVVVRLELCGMVKEGITALIRLGNWMTLRTAEHAGLELNLIELEDRSVSLKWH